MVRTVASKSLALLCSIAVLALVCASALAEKRRPPQPPGVAGGGVVNLPHMVNDNAGNQWMIYQGGWLQQQGNSPVYSQAAMLMINGNHVQSNTNQARQDDKTGEIVFENMVAQGVTVTRRVLLKPDEGYARYIDILRNTQAQDQSVNVSFQTNFNYGVVSSTTVADPKAKNRQLAWVGQTQVGRAILEVYGGRGVKSLPEILATPNNNLIRAQMQISIPAGKEIALVHLHGSAASQEAGVEFVESIKESKLFADVPAPLRKLIVNFGFAGHYIDDREILRGDLFDVVELRSGDVVKGTLREPSYKLQTFYGAIELPADRVVGLMNVGQFRPRQLVISTEGEIFGGQLAKETVALELSSGQVTQIPLSQVSRLGYRKRPGEPEEWLLDKPTMLLRSGDRIGVAVPQGAFEVLTRYGLLKLAPSSVAAIAFQAEEHGVHQVFLTDGSAFAGLVTAPQFDMKLSGPTAQAVSFPTSALRRLQLAAAAEPTDDAPTLLLANEDLLVGTLSGQLKLDTTFDTITLDAAQVRGLTRAADSGLDVQVTLWDQTTVSGQLQDPQITCALRCGVTVSVPIALVQEYSNPAPKPSDSMVERVKAVVAELSADDWNQRERAQADLVAMGPVVASVLREMLPAQPPEAQQRIESVLKQLSKPARSGAVPAPMDQ